MTSRPVRDLSAERRRAAAAAVDAFLDDLAAELPPGSHRVVEGSAIAAEVRFSGDLLARAVLRVDLELLAADRTTVEAALSTAGYRPAAAAGDIALMRVASRHGRRPVHVILDTEPADAAGGPGSRRPHPGSDEGVRDRARRLAGAFRPVLATWSRSLERPGRTAEDTVLEEREVHLVGPRPGVTGIRDPAPAE